MAAMDPRISHGLAEGEKMVECPYDSSHLILGQRMGTHLCRCRRNYEKKLKEKGGQVTKVTCAYHPLHLCVDAELAYHQNQCPYKFKDYKQELTDLRALVPKRTDEDKAHAEFARKVSEDELWKDADLEGDGQAKVYPKPPKADRVSFFVPSGLSKSDKKAYRQALIKRNNSIVDKTFIKVRSVDEGAEASLDAEKLKFDIENKFKKTPDQADTDGDSPSASDPEQEDCIVKFSSQEELNAKKDTDASVATPVDGEPEIVFTAETAAVADPNEEDEEDDEFWDARSSFSAFSLTK